MKKTELLTLRTMPKIEQKLKKLTELDIRSRPDEVRFVLELGIKERLKEVAVEKYMKKEVTLEKAAKIAEISVWEMVELLQSKKIPYNLDIDAIIEALK